MLSISSWNQALNIKSLWVFRDFKHNMLILSIYSTVFIMIFILLFIFWFIYLFLFKKPFFFLYTSKCFFLYIFNNMLVWEEVTHVQVTSLFFQKSISPITDLIWKDTHWILIVLLCYEPSFFGVAVVCVITLLLVITNFDIRSSLHMLMHWSISVSSNSFYLFVEF